MHTRRLATLLLGLWLGGGLFMTWVAIHSFRGVDKLLKSPAPAAAQYIKVLGNSSARTLLRHQIGELNRHYFSNWEVVQIGIALVFLLTMLFDAKTEKLYLALGGLALLLVIVQHFLFTPQVATLGRAIEFLPPEAPSAERVGFWRFHNAYSVLEIAKGLLLMGMSVRLVMISSRRRRSSRKKVDLVDDSDNG